MLFAWPAYQHTVRPEPAAAEGDDGTETAAKADTSSADAAGAAPAAGCRNRMDS